MRSLFLMLLVLSIAYIATKPVIDATALSLNNSANLITGGING